MSIDFPEPRSDAAPVPRCGVTLDAALCRDRASALAREWLVTNGIGGYAMGTIAGAATRRYHGLLVAATRPPAERTFLLGKVEERLTVGGLRHDLSANCWRDDLLQPTGFQQLANFRLERGVPTWRWEIGAATLEKRVAMVHGANAVLVEYRLLPGSAPCELRLEALATNRSHHDLVPCPAWTASVARHGDALLVRLPATASGAPPQDLWLHCPGATVEPLATWWRDIDLPTERERGYDFRDTWLLAGAFTARLAPGTRVTFGAAVGVPLPRDPQVLFVAEQSRRQTLLDLAGCERASGVHRHLVHAADDFVVRRPLPSGSEGWSIIAGYPWFADWSRDTMAALPGLLLATRRYPAARGVLDTYARHLSAGMLPNRFPDRPGDPLEYNAVDAPLLFLRAVGLLDAADPDPRWLRGMWPAATSIVEAFERGTRHGIAVDPADGLLAAGQAGLQLTWMDAKVDGRVVTPRMGKPVEVNALWYQALRHLESFALRLGEDRLPWARRAERVRESFGRFWNRAEECLYDVLDGPDGADPSIRPNQILAAGLEHTPLEPPAVAAVARRVASTLLVPGALRTLAPSDPRYVGRYEGDVVSRDHAYHQGTAWPWLLAFFARAWRRSGGDPALLDGMVAALAAHLQEGGIGSVSEILDGNPPHLPRGCPAQAWSVAAFLELLDLEPLPAGDTPAVTARTLAETLR